MSYSEVPDNPPMDEPGMPMGLYQLGDHWGLMVGYGVVMVLLGIVLTTWPGHTLVALVVLLAIQFIITGVFKILSAISWREIDGGARALMGLSGGLSLLAGLLCLRSPCAPSS